MSLNDECYDCLSSAVMNCMFCISHVQQAYQVAQLFQSSHQNSDENNNDNQLHCEATPLIYLHEDIELDSLSLYITPDDQLNCEQIEAEAPMSNKQFLKDGSTIVLDPLSICKTELSEDPKSPSPESLISECNLTIKSSSDLSADDDSQASTTIISSLGQVQSHTQASLSIPHARKQRKRNKRRKCHCPNCSIDGGNKTMGLNGKPQHVCHIQNCGRVFIYVERLKQHLDLHRSTKNIHKCPREPIICRCPNCKIDGGNKTRGPNGKLLHACHFLNCGRVFFYIRALDKHLKWHNRESRKKRRTRLRPLLLPKTSDSHVKPSQGIISPLTSQAISDTQDFIPAALSEINMPFPIFDDSNSCLDKPVYVECASLEPHETQSDEQDPVLPKPTLKDPLSLDDEPTFEENRTENGKIIRGPDGKLQHQCPIPSCGKVFQQLGGLKTHLYWHNVPKDLPMVCSCPNCSVNGGNKTKGPDGKLQHLCHIPDCGLKFHSVGALKMHLHWHSSEKNFGCTYCNMRFARKTKALQHAMKHISEEQEGYENDGNTIAKSHRTPSRVRTGDVGPRQVKSHLGLKLPTCSCPLCGRKFIRKQHLNRHLRTNVCNKSLICLYCKKECENSYTLSTHINWAHKNLRYKRRT